MKLFGYLCLLLLSSSVWSSPIPDFPFVTLTGESTRNVTPDNAIINVDVLVFSQDSDTAQKTLTTTVDGILTILKKNSVNEQAITSDEIRKNIKRAREKNGYNTLAILGYELSQSFEIKLADLAHYSVITSELLKTDHVKNIKSRFDVKNREAIEIELISEAGEKAKAKAKQMALGLGVKIDSVFAINDSGSYQSFFATFGFDNNRGVAMRMRGVSGNNHLFIPKHIEISKSINVVYKLED